MHGAGQIGQQTATPTARCRFRLDLAKPTKTSKDRGSSQHVQAILNRGHAPAKNPILGVMTSSNRKLVPADLRVHQTVGRRVELGG
jgi:hypothetical protein